MPEILIFAEVLVIEIELLAGMFAVRSVIYQPQYFPRLHYFARILNADVFSVADDVQFVRKHAYHCAGTKHSGPSYQAHTPIKSSRGALLLDVPTENGFKTIAETCIRYGARCDRFRDLRVIAQEYRKAPRFAEVFPSIESFFSADYATIADLNIASIRWGLARLFETDEGSMLEKASSYGFRLARMERSSESGVKPSDKENGRDANDWLVDLCRHHGADEYYFGGTGASSYMDFSKFERAGIRLVQQDWKLQPYPQLHGDFLPNLSIIDLLMNVEPAEARERLVALA